MARYAPDMVQLLCAVWFCCQAGACRVLRNHSLEIFLACWLLRADIAAGCLYCCVVVLYRSRHLPSVDDITSDVLSILDLHRLTRVTVIAHSYGTFVASRMAQAHRHRMEQMCLIDPVCLSMFLPDLLSNFIYRRPRVAMLTRCDAASGLW